MKHYKITFRNGETLSKYGESLSSLTDRCDVIKIEIGKPYPLEEGKMVKYPLLSDGMWHIVDVLLPDGYAIGQTEFEKKEDCQKACDVHNNFHGWTKEEVIDIVNQSMGLI